MIRNVVVGRVRPDVSAATIDAALAAIKALDVVRGTDLQAGRDLGLRDGNWSFAIVGDFADEAAYRRYDEDAEHNRVRREMVAPMCEEIVRLQFTV